MKPPEVHVYQHPDGTVRRVEFHDGPQRIEIAATRIVRTDTFDDRPMLEMTLIAKPIYHLDES